MHQRLNDTNASRSVLASAHVHPIQLKPLPDREDDLAVQARDQISFLNPSFEAKKTMYRNSSRACRQSLTIHLNRKGCS